MKLRYYNILIGALLLASCSKELPEVDTPDFDITAVATTVKAGEVVKFDITGDADIVSFYSGEPLKEFAYRNGRIADVKGAGATLIFNTSVTGNALSQGTLSTTVPPHLTVLASTNFNGTYNHASAQAATWTDITSRFRYAISGAAFVTASPAPPAGVDISDLIVADKPLYIAFRHETKPQAANGITRSWLIESFSITSKKDIGTTAIPVLPVITNQIGAGFRLIDQFPTTAPSRSIINSSRITLLGNLYDAVNDPTNDPLTVNWAISKPIDVNTVDLGSDKGTAIKDQIKESALTTHSYTYAKPGTYKATFAASNNNIDGSKEVVKEILITVTP